MKINDRGNIFYGFCDINKVAQKSSNPQKKHEAVKMNFMDFSRHHLSHKKINKLLMKFSSRKDDGILIENGGDLRQLIPLGADGWEKFN